MSSLRLIRAESASPAAHSDAELVRQFLDGDRQAFGQLLSRHQEPVFRVVRRYASTPEDAKDLVQKAFVQALSAARRVLPRLQAQREGDLPFRAWLLRIAVNLAKNHVRDAARWNRAPLEVVDAERQATAAAPSSHAQLERAQAEALVRKAVLELPKRQREVFTLRIDADLPFAEVASALGITEGNAKTHFHYAVKRLREVVQRLEQAPKETP